MTETDPPSYEETMPRTHIIDTDSDDEKLSAKYYAEQCAGVGGGGEHVGDLTPGLSGGVGLVGGVGGCEMGGECCHNKLDSLLNYNEFQHDEYLNEQMKRNFPRVYAAVDSLVMIVLNVVLIGLQIVAIQNNAAFSNMGSALWSGIYNLAVVLVVVLTIKFRNSTILMIASVLKLFGMIISFLGFVLVHLIALYQYRCIAASHYRPCYNADMMHIHYAFICLGLPCVLLSFWFFAYFQFKFLGRIRLFSPPPHPHHYHHQHQHDKQHTINYYN